MNLVPEGENDEMGTPNSRDRLRLNYFGIKIFVLPYYILKFWRTELKIFVLPCYILKFWRTKSYTARIYTDSRNSIVSTKKSK